MPEKWILTFSDQELVSPDMQHRLDQTGQKYNVIAVGNIQAAQELIDERPFDLIIVDDQGPANTGLRFLEQVQATHPGFRLLYLSGSSDPKAIGVASRLNSFRSIPRPRDEQALQQVIEEELQVAPMTQSGISILGEDDYQKVNEILQRLETDVGARGVCLTDAEGMIIADTGRLERIAITRLSSLLSGSIASLAEAEREIDNLGGAVNLAFSEGKSEDLYAINIGSKYLLIILIDRGPSSSRLGLVWYYARIAAALLVERLKHAKYSTPGNIFGDDLDQALNGEFDRLFTDDEKPGVDQKAAEPKSTQGDAVQPARKLDSSRPNPEETHRPGGFPGSSQGNSAPTRKGEK